eukprot:CAMPEP_0197712726 /NCGR_PEP_ID=MMETSP1338-20131121/130101_1 /TAXON_ID=43686 ORGANISM="Pelagodinium beii, Strain RCC1491" /NCGR_SAMPLE_ID=MMETSP1338 /ASSEMBLY_ACC=CAM_ASM_000754 /LENGTH=62 /DNA_ID=CAMNT_0043296663 /DNA_START=371 /DNA_END=559 /DNA_ORIENTATION=-
MQNGMQNRLFELVHPNHRVLSDKVPLRVANAVLGNVPPILRCPIMPRTPKSKHRAVLEDDMC